jgi:hypothetical protein
MVKTSMKIWKKQEEQLRNDVIPVEAKEGNSQGIGPLHDPATLCLANMTNTTGPI